MRPRVARGRRAMRPCPRRVFKRPWPPRVFKRRRTHVFPKVQLRVFRRWRAVVGEAKLPVDELTFRAEAAHGAVVIEQQRAFVPKLLFTLCLGRLGCCRCNLAQWGGYILKKLFSTQPQRAFAQGHVGHKDKRIMQTIMQE